MNKIAIFISSRHNNLLFQSELINHNRFKPVGSIDYYSFTSTDSHIHQDNNLKQKIYITEKEFYTFFDDLTDKYDFVIFAADFPLYDCNITHCLISVACKKIHKYENVFFDYKHKHILEKLGCIIDTNTCLLLNRKLIQLFSIFPYQKLDTVYSLYPLTTLQQFQKQYPFDDNNDLAYAYTGAYYKVGSIINILSHYNLTNKIFSILDLGSGLCLVALELFLQFCKDIRSLSIDCVDVQYSDYVNKLINCYPTLISKEHFKFFQLKMINFHFAKKYDFVYLIGSLLYIPREEVSIMLNNILDNLNPGGLLCIHENIKHPQYTRHFHLMFEVTELENYLKKLGNISYFHGKTGQYINQHIELNKTLFRVIQKQ